MDDKLRRQEFGGLLRELRARMAPGDVGLPVRARSRTPGLRREDVAALAGISSTLYTWLEQGRDLRVTPRVAKSLMQAFQLNPIERIQFRQLALPGEGQEEVSDTVVSPLLQRLIDRWDMPAIIRNRRWDILAWNRAARAVIIDFEKLVPEQRNTLCYCFTDPSHQSFFADWDSEARNMVARFRVDYTRYVGDPSFSELVARLSQQSELFAELWQSHDILPQGEVAIRYNRPDSGPFTSQHVHLKLTATSELSVILWVPPVGGQDERRIRAIIDAFSDN